MKILFGALLFSFLTQQLFAQNDLYQQKTAAGADFLAAGKYAEAARAYSGAFESFGWRGYLNDRLNAARAWSMAGVPDSAFFNLFRIAERAGYDDLDALNEDKLFDPLRTDARWPQLCARVKSNQPTMPELANTLFSVLENDQRYRMLLDSVEAATGPNSGEMQQLWKTISLHDSINESIVTGILDQYGWLGPSEVGGNGSNALFLVIQHAPLPVQEKYLPMMREAVKAGKAQGSSLALLEDRVLMRNGKKQIYGSQVRSNPETGEKYFFPIEDVDQVDRRRAGVGLGPLAEYAQHFGIEWNEAAIEKNKRMVPDPPEKH